MNTTGAGGRKRRTKKILEGVSHGRNGYAQGCGCTRCCTEEKQYQQYIKAKRKGLTELTFREWQKEQKAEAASVTQLHSVPDSTDETEDDIQVSDDWPGRPKNNGHLGRGGPRKVGPHEQAVIDECAKLSMADERPAMVMAARNAARIMDTPKQAALHTQASRQMVSILNDLRGTSKKKSGGRLAKVQSMTRTTRASNG